MATTKKATTKKATKNKTSNKPKGRPSGYALVGTPDNLKMLEEMSLAGATNIQMAKALNISESMFYRYAIDHSEFREAIKVTKNVADDKEELSLYKRAMGYDYEEAVEDYAVDPETGDTILRSRKVYKKHMPSETTAIIFWLSNRRNQEWKRNRPEAVISDSETGVIEIPAVEVANGK